MEQIIRSKYRPEIDGLRGVAVLTVILNHFNKNILPGGYLGVDIFFVISGYVITSSLAWRSSNNLKEFISGFYERRIRRLVPVLVVFVFITSIVICFFNASPGVSLQTGLASLFGVSNIFLLNQSTDYFAPSTQLNVFTHTWSLGVEEQFYILFPLIAWFSGFGRKTKNGVRNFFLLISALSVVSFLGFVYFYSTDQSAAYFLMPTRFWEMASGCLLFIGFQKRKSIEQFLEKVPPTLVLILIVGIMYLPFFWTTASTVSVVALTLVLIASLKKQTTAFAFFTNSKVVYVGLISYSLYLWHWGVLSISRWTIGIHWWSIPFQVVLMFYLANASYRYIEKPLREGNWYGTDFAGLTPPWDDNMGYSFHKYWGSTALSTIQQYLNLRDQHNVPLWMGESGENSNEWYYQVFKLFEENNIGWNFWTHKKVDKLTSPYSAYVSPQYQLILDYVSGNIDQLDANLASMGWTSLANSLKIEKSALLASPTA